MIRYHIAMFVSILMTIWYQYIVQVDGTLCRRVLYLEGGKVVEWVFYILRDGHSIEEARSLPFPLPQDVVHWQWGKRLAVRF